MDKLLETVAELRVGVTQRRELVNMEGNHRIRYETPIRVLIENSSAGNHCQRFQSHLPGGLLEEYLPELEPVDPLFCRLMSYTAYRLKDIRQTGEIPRPIMHLTCR